MLASKKIRKAARNAIVQQVKRAKPGGLAVCGSWRDLAKCFPFDFGERMT
jgi:hypothetical protein